MLNITRAILVHEAPVTKKLVHLARCVLSLHKYMITFSVSSKLLRSINSKYQSVKNLRLLVEIMPDTAYCTYVLLGSYYTYILFFFLVDRTVHFHYLITLPITKTNS